MKDTDRGSTVSIISDCRLGDMSLIPGEGFFYSICVQKRSEARPASYPTDTAGPLKEVKHSQSVTLTTHPHLVPRSGMNRSCVLLPFDYCMVLLYFTDEQGVDTLLSLGSGSLFIDYDGLRLCLRTATTNGPIAHPPNNM
jgi:hypothetical protein